MLHTIPVHCLEKAELDQQQISSFFQKRQKQKESTISYISIEGKLNSMQLNSPRAHLSSRARALRVQEGRVHVDGAGRKWYVFNFILKISFFSPVGHGDTHSKALTFSCSSCFSSQGRRGRSFHPVAVFRSKQG